MFPSHSDILRPINAAKAIPLVSDPGAVLTNAFRLSHLARHWGLTGPLAGTLAALAYGSARDE